MNRKQVLTILVLISSLMLISCNAAEADNGNGTEAVTEVVATNLEVPWDIDFLPGGSIIVTERTGAVKVVEEGTPNTVGVIDVAATGEAGLLGIALDPDFAANGEVFIYYTYYSGGDMFNRVSKFNLDDSLYGEIVMIDSIPASSIHDGGRLEFGPDGRLYITTGDAAETWRSGDPDNLGGKILRMNRDGSVPADNPFGNMVYAKGLRNCEGVDWHNDTMFAVDHGPTRHDEVNIIEMGEDYGWPNTCDEHPAYRCYTEFTLAPADIAVRDTFIYVSGLRGNQIRKINRATGDQEAIFINYGRIRPLQFHGGYLYFGTSNRDGRGVPKAGDDKIIRTTEY